MGWGLGDRARGLKGPRRGRGRAFAVCAFDEREYLLRSAGEGHHAGGGSASRKGWSLGFSSHSGAVQLCNQQGDSQTDVALNPRTSRWYCDTAARAFTFSVERPRNALSQVAVPLPPTRARGGDKTMPRRRQFLGVFCWIRKSVTPPRRNSGLILVVNRGQGFSYHSSIGIRDLSCHSSNCSYWHIAKFPNCPRPKEVLLLY